MAALPDQVECVVLNGEAIWVPRRDLRFRPGGYGVLVKEERVLLIRSLHQGLLDLPGGGIEPGEALTEAVAREFREETGLEVCVGEVVHASEAIFTYPPYIPPSHCVRVYYRVEAVGGELLARGNGVDSFGCVWKPLKQLEPDACIPHVYEAVNAAQGKRRGW